MHRITTVSLPDFRSRSYEFIGNDFGYSKAIIMWAAILTSKFVLYAVLGNDRTGEVKEIYNKEL